MGALLARLRWRRPPATGPEAAEQKEDTPAAEPRSEDSASSPTPQVTSSYHSVEEARPSSGISSASDAASSEQSTKPKEEAEQTEAEKKDATPPEAREKELERVQETKVEKEKTVDSSGTTTEKTVYTQYTESTKIHESKGERPAFQPFDSPSQTTVFPQFTEIKIPPAPREEEKSPPSSSPKSTYVHNVEIQTASEVENVSSEVSSGNEKAEDVDYNRSDVADAVVKIQAGVRGYLTRKSLKGNKRDPTSDEQTTNGVSEEMSHPSEVDSHVVAEEEVATHEEEEDEEVSSENTGEEDAAVKIQALYRGYRTRKHLDGIKSEPLDHPPSKVITEVESSKSSVGVVSQSADAEEISSEREKSPSAEIEESVEVVSQGEKGQEQAATKIQAAFRGYKVRKDFKEDNNPPAENSALEASTEDREQTVEEAEATDDFAKDLLSSSSDAGAAMQNEIKDAEPVVESLCGTVESQPEQQEPDLGLLVDISQSPERDHVPSEPEEDVEEQEDSSGVDVGEVQWQTSEIYVQDSNESPAGTAEKSIPEESSTNAASTVNSVQFSTTTTLLIQETHPQRESSDTAEPQQEELSVSSVVKDTQDKGSEEHKAQ